MAAINIFKTWLSSLSSCVFVGVLAFLLTRSEVCLFLSRSRLEQGAHEVMDRRQSIIDHACVAIGVFRERAEWYVSERAFSHARITPTYLIDAKLSPRVGALYAQVFVRRPSVGRCHCCACIE